jgi:outer membrane protein TolC
MVRAVRPAPQAVEEEQQREAPAANARQLTVSLNRLMGWPDDTELELVQPEPLVENISLQQVADRSVAANLEVIEAEQTAVKARAGAAVSKLAYLPTVSLVSGYPVSERPSGSAEQFRLRRRDGFVQPL